MSKLIVRIDDVDEEFTASSEDFTLGVSQQDGSVLKVYESDGLEQTLLGLFRYWDYVRLVD